MIFTLDDINALLEGRRNPVHVGELPIEVAEAVGVVTPNVYLALERINHIFNKHRDVTKFDLLILPTMIQSGLIVRENKSKTILVASYVHPVTNKRYVAPMKIANNNCEVWISSFYRVSDRQTKALLKRSKILKTHD